MNNKSTMSMENPVLVCRNHEGKIQHVDIGEAFCQPQFIWFGPLKPTFPCGDPNNRHTCEKMSIDIKKFAEQLAKK